MQMLPAQLDALVQDQLSRIVRRYPVKTEVDVHRDADGSVASCCTAALTALEGAVKVSEANFGVAGVMSYLRDSMHWGSHRGEYWCTCVENITNLDCGASAALAVLALALTEDVRAGRVQIGTAQVAFRCTPTAAKRWRRYFVDDKRDDHEPDLDWVHSVVCYHHCIALVEPKSREMRLWSFDYWFDGPRSAGDEAGVVALRFTPLQMHKRMPYMAGLRGRSDPPCPPTLRFGDMEVPTREWVTFLPGPLALPGVLNKVPVAAPHLAGDEAAQAVQASEVKPTPASAAYAPALPPCVDAVPLPKEEAPTVLISGVAMNNDNPCSGVGIGRALRRRFPSSHLVGLDYTWESAGLCDPVFNEAHFFAHWQCTRGTDHTRDVAEMLAAHEGRAFYLPTLDKEVDMLAEGGDDLLGDWDEEEEDAEEEEEEAAAAAAGAGAGADCKPVAKNVRGTRLSREQLREALSRVLIPDTDALAEVSKPAIVAAQRMGMEVPDWLLVDPEEVSEQDVHAFCSRHGYPVFVKGPEHDAVLCASFHDVQLCVRSMIKTWGLGVHIQAAVAGFGAGIGFAAYKGELVGACMFTKTFSTPARKGWGGRIESVPADLLEALRVEVARLNWTGGAELEFVHTLDGRRVAVDWNPRFPAWIAGADAAAGVNLPGALVQAALRDAGAGAHAALPLPPPPELTRLQPGAAPYRGYFVRTIVELPMSTLQPVVVQGPESVARLNVGGKHPSRTEDLAAVVNRARKERELAFLKRIQEKRRSRAGSSSSDDNKAGAKEGAVSRVLGKERVTVGMLDLRESDLEPQRDRWGRIKTCRFTKSMPRPPSAADDTMGLPSTPLRWSDSPEAWASPSAKTKPSRSDSPAIEAIVEIDDEQGAEETKGEPSKALRSAEAAVATAEEASTGSGEESGSAEDPMARNGRHAVPTPASEETKSDDLSSVDPARGVSGSRPASVSGTVKTVCPWVPPPASSLPTLRRELQALTTDPSLLTMATPGYGLSLATVRMNLRGARKALSAVCTRAGVPSCRPCLSVKTQPNQAVLAAAADAGFLAECISMAELAAARRAGFDPEEIVITGPAKWYGLPQRAAPAEGDDEQPARLREALEEALEGRPLAAVFADSVEDLQLVVQLCSGERPALRAAVVGMRFAPGARVTSRFGVDPSHGEQLLQTAKLMAQLPASQRMGVHVHMAQSHLGLSNWEGVARAGIVAAESLQRLSGRRLATLDVGGGWTAHALEDPEVQARLESVLQEAARRLPDLSCVQIEPGKTVTERAGCMVTTIQTVRTVTDKQREGLRSTGGNELGQDLHHAAVVDACICDLGSLPTHSHPVLLYQDGGWRPLPPGKDVILGRVCMEWDVVAKNIKLPDTARPGQRLMIAFTGAYDTSQSFPFGDGVGRPMKLLE